MFNPEINRPYERTSKQEKISRRKIKSPQEISQKNDDKMSEAEKMFAELPEAETIASLGKDEKKETIDYLNKRLEEAGEKQKEAKDSKEKFD